jgi:hypothetical protein
MAYPASLTLISTSMDPSTALLYFITATTEGGSPLSELVHQEQELLAEGVDGRRWRTVYDQYVPFQMQTVMDATTYTIAANIRETYRQCRGRIGVLSVASADKTTKFRVHITEIEAACAPAKTVGANATVSATAWIVGNWTMVRIPGAA